MPEWAMLLCIPRSLRSKTQQEEIAFFRRATPVPAPASFEASYVALFEIYAPIVEGDYAGFCQGVSRMQQTAWKRAERAEYGAPLKKLELALAEAGADCVGMSSLGPMLFCFGKAESLVEITNASDTLDCDMHLTFPANCGRQVSVGHA
jgi:beta-ribofuranosylaminobenzene 5'-phosphate synthase